MGEIMTYDPKMKMERVWKRLPKKEVCKQWLDREAFQAWGHESGADHLGVRIVRPDTGQPFGPENCLVLEDASKEEKYGVLAPPEAVLNQKLWTAWNKFIMKDHAEEWDDFWNFFRWAKENGAVEPGASLRRIDRERPIGPDNATYIYVGAQPADKAKVRDWNRTVNRLRKYFGLPLFREEPEEEGQRG